MSKLSIILGAVVFVILVGVGIGFLGSRGSAPESVALPEPEEAVAPVAQQRAVAPAQIDPRIPSVEKAPSPGGSNNLAASIPVQPVPATGLTNWEDKVEGILINEDTTDVQKVQQMAAMFPALAPDAQEEVAQHMSNLTPDEQYGLGQYLTNAALPEAVLEVFLADVLNRPNLVKMPLLLDIARNQQHPGSAEARDLMELFLEEDYGNDWNLWQTKMQEWLKENPED